jgi:hypothetical protein
VEELVVGLAQPLISISWHDLHGAFCLFQDEIVGPIVGLHLSLSLFILDRLLVKMSLIVASERVYAQGAPGLLECHGEYTKLQKSVGTQVMDLQVEALQNFAHKIFTVKP